MPVLRPFLRVPKTVTIQNLRLNLAYVVLVVAVLVYCIWKFMGDLGFTTTINNGPELLMIFDTASLEDASGRLMPDGLCAHTQWHPSKPATWDLSIEHAYLRFRCEAMCKGTVTTDCQDRYEMGEISSVRELAFRLSRTVIEDGPNVTIPENLGPSIPLPPGTVLQESTFFPAADQVGIQFDVKYALERNVPFFFWTNNGIEPRGQTEGAQDSAVSIRTVVLDRDGRPWRSFGHGEEVSLKATEVFQAATGRSTGAVPAGLEGYVNGSATGSYSEFPFWVYLSGSLVDATVDCFTNDHDLRSRGNSNSNVDWSMSSSPAEPVCLLQFAIVAPRDYRLSVEKESGRIRRTSISSLRIVSKQGRSFHRVPDLNATVLNLTSMIVLLSLPQMLMRFVILHLLGHLSRVYRHVVDQGFDIRSQCGRTVTQLMANTALFSELANVPGPNGEEHGGISRDRMLRFIKATLRHQKNVLDPQEVNALNKTGFDQTVKAPTLPRLEPLFLCASRHEDPPGDILTIDDFSRTVGNHDLPFDDIVRLFDADRRRGWGETLFTPPELWRAIHASKTGAESQDTSQGGSDQMSVDHDDIAEGHMDRARRNSVLHRVSKETLQKMVRTMEAEMASLHKWRSMAEMRLEALEAAQHVDVV